MTRAAKAGFTIMELLIVVAMMTILMGAVSSSVAKSQTRAKISRASVDCREITNAILAYENYNENHSLEEFVMEDRDADQGSMKFILGEGGTAANGDPIPVLYNGALSNGKLLDPWGIPYKVTVRRATGMENANQVDSTARDMVMSVFIPNLMRLSPEERGR